MARRKHGSVPGIRLHKPTGKAVVTLSGQDFYCGTWGTKVALAEYDKQVAEWLARGRRPLATATAESAGITVVELLAAYKRFAKGYYRKNGKVTTEVHAIGCASNVVMRCTAANRPTTSAPSNCKPSNSRWFAPAIRARASTSIASASFVSLRGVFLKS